MRFLASQLCLGGVGFLILLLSLVLPRGRRQVLLWVALLGAVAAIILSAMLWRERQMGAGTAMLWGGMAVTDGLSIFGTILFSGAAALALMLSEPFVRAEGIDPTEYSAIILFAACGMSFFAATTNLLVLFLGLETLSIAFYILAGSRRNDLRSDEAALKYFLLGAFCSTFLLYGIALIYGSTGSFDLLGISAKLRENPPGGGDLLVPAGMALLLVGFAFKAALVPFHVWAPDVYEGAPTPVTAFFAAGGKAAALVVLLRVLSTGLPELRGSWVPVLWVLSALSMFVGSVVAIAQTNIKRMLAYSSISHAGYISLGVLAGSSLGTMALLFYLFVYVVVNSAAFGVVQAMRNGDQENLELSDYAGLGTRRPWLAASMAIFMLSLTGIPPMVGFAAKWYIFGAAVQAGFVGLAVLGVLCSAISAFFYLRVIVIMYMREPEGEATWQPTGPALGIAIGLGVAVALVIGIWPAWLLSLAQSAAEAIVR